MSTLSVIALLVVAVALVAIPFVVRQWRSGHRMHVDPRGADVRFTVYRPRAIVPEKWYDFLVFAHRTELNPDLGPADSPAARVEREAERLLGAGMRTYSKVVEDSAAPVVPHTQVTFVPSIEGVEFNPPRVMIDWTEDVHRAQFQMRADGSLDGHTARGSLAVYSGPLLLAELALVIPVSVSAAQMAESAPALESVNPYRKVFASYSHDDTEIVGLMETYARALGDQYLRDVTTLRSGEDWNDRLLELIEEADVFQLFWSWNALESEYVRREWMHALSLQRAHFVRPVYWEDPLPASPERGLPPAELRAIHFQRLPFGGPSPVGSKPEPAGEVPPPPEGGRGAPPRPPEAPSSRPRSGGAHPPPDATRMRSAPSPRTPPDRPASEFPRRDAAPQPSASARLRSIEVNSRAPRRKSRDLVAGQADGGCPVWPRPCSW